MLRRPQFWSYVFGLGLLVYGLNVGARFPDVDQRFSFLPHRSFLTHGLLLPMLLFIGIRHYLSRPDVLQQCLDILARLFVIGFCLANAVHLCFDFFPRGWYGFALIWVPFVGRATPTFSWMWIGISCVVCLYLAILLVRHLLEMVLGALGLAATFFSQSVGENSVFVVLVVLLMASGLVLIFPSRAMTLVWGWVSERA